MVTIAKGSVNNVVVTLFEKTTMYNPNYLFEFKNKESKVLKYCLVGSNLTTDPTRYDEFEITETTSPDPLQSEIELSEGDHIYTVYQLTDEQVTELNFNSIDTTSYVIVEGACHAKVTATPLVKTYYTEAVSTNTIYEG